MMPARDIFVGSAIGLSLLASAAGAGAQPAAAAATNADYIAKLTTAAPPQIVRNATIVRMEGSAIHTLKRGTNGFTCMVMGNGTPMCADPNAMAWAHALATHAPPPDKTGFIYMLAGDTGTSNTNPYATKSEPGNHWVQTGPHVMVVGAAAKTMAGYPRTPDPDPTKPYVMWPGTPYEHLMLPVK
jgi:hypothetical protein